MAFSCQTAIALGEIFFGADDINLIASNICRVGILIDKRKIVRLASEAALSERNVHGLATDPLMTKDAVEAARA